MKNLNFENTPKFKNAQEELDFLRAHIAEREKAISEKGEEVKKESLAHDVLNEYRKFEPKEVMHPNAIIKESHVEAMVLRLKPESHDSNMEELLGILLDKGISSALSVVFKMNNPHIDDDFHRFLIPHCV